MSAHTFIEPEGEPRAATGHMPFVGHRTVAAVWARQANTRRSARLRERKAMEYGFDPDCVRREGR